MKIIVANKTAIFKTQVKMKNYFLLLLCCISTLFATAQTKRTLLYSGPSASKFDIVFMGDGFTSSQQGDFNTRVDNYFKAMFTYQNGDMDNVLAELQDAFNVYRVNMNSVQSGVADQTCTNADGDSCGASSNQTRNTAYRFTYSGCWDCCWMGWNGNSVTRINNALSAVGLAGAEYVVMILNETGFGGCSGGRILSITKTTSNHVLLHELGHSVGALADEYGNKNKCYGGSNPSSRNMDTNMNNAKWNKFARASITTGQPAEYNVSQSGHFEGGKYVTRCIYRPTTNSTMRGNTNLFNPPSYDEFWKRNKPRSKYNFDKVITGNFGGSNHSDVLLHYGNYIAAYQVGRPDGFTGDGRATRVKSSYVTTKKITGSGGTWYVSSKDKFYVGDFTGDGKDDLFAVYQNGTYQRLGLLKSTATGFECVKKYTTNLPGWAMKDGDRHYVADFNGDGKDDIYIFNAKNWSMGYVGMLRSTGSSLVYTKRYDKYLPGNYITDSDELYVADIDGDRKEEFVLFKRNTRTTRIYKSNGSALTMSGEYFQSLPGWTNAANDKYMIGDINGDGKDDLYVFNGKDWNMEYMLLLRSNGSSYNYVKRYDDRMPNWNMSDNDKFLVADINGDRKDDLYVYNTADWSTQWLGTVLSSGSGVEANTKQSDWIGGWNLGPADKLIVDDRPSGNRDNLYIHNTNWFGYMWPGGSGMYIKGMYKDYIHAFKHHDYGWY